MARKEIPLAGFHAVAAVLSQSPDRVLRLLIRKDRSDQRVQELANAARAQGIAVEKAGEDAMQALFAGNHQGVVAICRPARSLDDGGLADHLDQLDHAPLLLALDGVTDPHNLGACLRSADGAGVDAVILPKDRSVGPGPVVSRVASGAAEVIPIAMVTNLARTMQELKSRGVWITGTDDQAPAPIWQTDLTGPRLIVLGSEGRGMRRLVREHCDETMSIPMAGVVSSLNVSVAAGVCLFEALRQRQVSA